MKNYNNIDTLPYNSKSAIDHLLMTFEGYEKQIKDLKDQVVSLQNVPSPLSYKEYIFSKLNVASFQYTIEQLQEFWEQDKKVSEENKEISAQNIKLHKIAIDYLKGLGLKETKTIKNYRSLATKQAPCAWVSEVAAAFPIINKEYEVNNFYERSIENIKKHNQDKINDINRARAEQEKLNKIKERDAFIIRLIDKYKFDFINPIPDVEDVLFELIKKDKYLRLGDYLLMNRNDWSEGPRYARVGLIDFSIQNAQDQLIHNEIQTLINNWSGDGRCFRDSQYSYDYMFSLVEDDELLKDYWILKGYAD
jgi:hypothetical protein